MKHKYFSALLLTAGLGLATLNALHADMLLTGVGAPPHGGGGGGFTGVGDTVAGAKGHWGTIAYSAATRGSAMLSLCDSSGANCADAATDATTGIVSSTQNRNGACTGSLVGTTYTAGANPCHIAETYDDSGANACGGSPCHLVQVSVGFQPLFIPNYNGTVPAIYFKSFTLFLAKSTRFTAITLPITMGMSAVVVSNSGANDRMFSIPDASGVTLINHVVGTEKGSINNGSFVDTGATMTLGTMFSLIGDIAASGASGGISLNGTRTAGTPGTQNSGTGIYYGADAGPLPCDCASTEAFVYASQLSGTNLSNENLTMRTNGGY